MHVVLLVNIKQRSLDVSGQNCDFLFGLVFVRPFKKEHGLFLTLSRSYILLLNFLKFYSLIVSFDNFLFYLFF